jgi:hypothetical protein
MDSQLLDTQFIVHLTVEVLGHDAHDHAPALQTVSSIADLDDPKRSVT